MEGQRPYTVRSPVGVAEDSLRSRESRVQTLRRIADRGLGARCVRRGHLCTQPKFNIQSRSRERPKIGRSQGRSPCDQSPAPQGRETCWPGPKPGLKTRERAPTPEGREFSGGGGRGGSPPPLCLAPSRGPGRRPTNKPDPEGKRVQRGGEGGPRPPFPLPTPGPRPKPALPRVQARPRREESAAGRGRGPSPFPPT